jgi:5-methylcytosine-specific restriction endonuclease McrA
LLEQCNFRCAYCGRQSAQLTRDHDVPLIRGGNHRIDNTRPACARCNSKKGRSTGDEFRARLARDAGHPESAA